MPIWPAQRKMIRAGNVSTLTEWSRNSGLAPTLADTAWPTADRAVYVPIRVDTLMPAGCSILVWFGGTITSLPWDTGLYRRTAEGKPGECIASVGGFVNVTSVQIPATHPALPPLAPDVYYLALVCHVALDTVRALATDSGYATAACGVYIQDNAYPLPDTAAPIDSVSGVVIPALALVVV